jgi:hypothetical protein
MFRQDRPTFDESPQNRFEAYYAPTAIVGGLRRKYSALLRGFR